MQATVCPTCNQWNAPGDARCGRCGAALTCTPPRADPPDGAHFDAPGSARHPTAPLPAVHWHPGQAVGGGRYRLTALLGTGASGDVYRAADERLTREVALKAFHAHALAQRNGRARALREAEALARIEHPNVVRIFDVFEEGERLTLVLELMPGGSLEDRQSRGRLRLEEACVLGHEILLGLQAIHDAGLVHRDLKPANVLLSARAVAKLADLGVAHEVQARGMTRLGAKLGTPEYMSPEQHRGEAVEARSDIYSAGVVLYELLAGALPFRHNSEYELAKAHVHEAPDLAPLEREAGPALAAVVGRALAKTLADRWPTAASMAAHWADAAQQSGFSVQRTPGTAQDSGAHSVAVPNSDVRNAVVEPAGGPALRVLNGPRAAQTLAFRDGRLALGRRDPDLGSLAGREEFDDPAMSWAHCTFVVQPDARVVVYDDGSLNGTWVDGVRVEGGSWVVAKSVVVAGRTRVAFVGDGE